MAWDTPDDWDCYWAKCSTCGQRYHLSEGGCSCAELTDEELEELLDERERRSEGAWLDSLDYLDELAKDD